ncbi:hypothetical protein JM946_27815 [Steroidobacter sp. S1-65]|uniref:Uncharacterized protein n=1 Tax=Steroidobacter gossypii TaxID=2805490 RepID=A0ABS1X5Q5_9GAMM|nr:hypothetical protein [Steroidobacter gossypii]MBM0108558.1 hypothetical protein [Steroidobacter gossypii]
MSGVHSRFAFLLAAAMFASAAVRAEEDRDVAGRWALTIRSEAGVQRPQLDLRQQRNQLLGTYADEFGKADVTGTIDGEEIVFRLRVEVPDYPLIVTFTGTLGKDTIQGDVQFGDIGKGTFTATRD